MINFSKEGDDFISPSGFVRIIKSGNKDEMTFYYRLLCPTGFRSLGDVEGTYNDVITKYKCVNERYVIKASFNASAVNYVARYVVIIFQTV